MKSVLTGILLAVLVTMLTPCASTAAHFDPASETFTFFAWRSLGSHSNDMPVVKTRSFIGSDGTPSVGETGMAEQGWHELHPLPGPQTAAFADRGDAYPSVAGPVMVGNKPQDWAVFDLLIRWVYDSDILAWTPEFRQMGQTFVANGPGLDKVSLHHVSGATDLVVTVRRGGPDGPQIGSAAEFVDGPPGDGIAPGWMIARWLPEDVALEPGATYYLDITSTSGRPFAIRTHSTGNIYSGGKAYFDGVAEPGSDLGVFIACQRDDMRRSPVLRTSRDNWVTNTRGVYFRASSSNIRVIYSQIRFPNTPFHLEAVYRVFKVEPDRHLTRIGMDKQGYNYAQPGSEHFTGVIYAADEIPLEVGQTYFLQVIPKGDGVPKDEADLPRMDLNVRIYGESISGMTPVIYNQHVVETTPTSVRLEWQGTAEVPTRVLYGLDPHNLDRVMEVPRGQNEVTLGPAAPGTTIALRLVKTTNAGGVFETPVYQVRTLGQDGKVVSDPPLRPTPAHQFLTQSIGFLNLAWMDGICQTDLPKVRATRRVELRNPDFFDGLDGWDTSGVKDIKPIADSEGRCAGWDLTFPESAGDSSAEETLTQVVRVIPGKSYMLTAQLYTKQEGHSDDFYARLQAGDVKARLVCDPAGGRDFAGANSSQWYRTDGDWLKFAKLFKAESDTATVGVSFGRYHDWPVVRALVDEVRLVQID